MVTFSIDHFAGQPDFAVAGVLIKVAFLCRFETSRRLKDHLPHGADPLKIETVGANAVYADISDHQHAQVPFPFRFSAHETGQQFHIFIVYFDNRHVFFSHFPSL